MSPRWYTVAGSPKIMLGSGTFISIINVPSRLKCRFTLSRKICCSVDEQIDIKADDGITTKENFLSEPIFNSDMLDSPKETWFGLDIFPILFLAIESISAGTDSSTYGDVDIWGAMYGIGLKARHSSGMFLKLEGSTTHFRPVRLESNSGNSPSKIYADIDIEAVRLAIGYTF